jgi:mannose-6-phosphate isomerase-like protein (cupin superfamily)
LIASIQIPGLMETDISKAVVNQPEDGEVFYVRENTPITIQISKQKNGVESISLCTEQIQPGGKIPVHKHLGEDEYFLFQQGNGIIEIDGAEYPIKAGTNGFVPKATWHSIRNISTEVLIFNFGYSPAGFEDFFRQIGTIKGLPFKIKSPEEIKMLADKYGMVYK